MDDRPTRRRKAPRGQNPAYMPTRPFLCFVCRASAPDRPGHGAGAGVSTAGGRSAHAIAGPSAPGATRQGIKDFGRLSRGWAGLGRGWWTFFHLWTCAAAWCSCPGTSRSGKRVKTCPESARCRAGVDPHRLVWAFPWRYPLPARCGSCAGFHRARLPSPRNSGRTCRPLTSSTSWARLRAALRSRSSTKSHWSHRWVRSARRGVVFTAPQAEQVLEEGYQRSATCRVLPSQRALYSIWILLANS
jgi:hypothetical protein